MLQITELQAAAGLGSHTPACRPSRDASGPEQRVEPLTARIPCAAVSCRSWSGSWFRCVT